MSEMFGLPTEEAIRRTFSDFVSRDIGKWYMRDIKNLKMDRILPAKDGF
jgi:hypothetical protein